MAHRLRIQRKRTKGWRMPDGAVFVGRPGPWGNPFRVQTCLEVGYANDELAARTLCVASFRDWLLKGDLSEWWFGDGIPGSQWLWMRENLHTLYRKPLACWCPLDRPCHADILAEFANLFDCLGASAMPTEEERS